MNLLVSFAVLQAAPAARASLLAPPAPVPSADSLDQTPDNLALKQALDNQYQEVLGLFQVAEQSAERYAQQYANKTVDAGSPEEAAGLAAYQQVKASVQSYRRALSDYSAKLAQLRPRPAPPPGPTPPAFALYVDPGSLLAKNDPKYNLAKIQSEIDGIRAALARLKSVKDMNDSQLDEWRKESEKASSDAWELGASLSVDLLTANLEARGEQIERQIGEATASMKGKTDTAELKAIQDSIDGLKTHQAQLEKAQEALEKAHSLVDSLSKAAEAAGGGEAEAASRDENVSKALEEAWEAASQAGALPPGASEAKGMADAAYLVAVQCVSVARVNQANANAESYLAAVDSLSQKMKDLVDLKNKAAAAAAH
jgi:hypothetical protein